MDGLQINEWVAEWTVSSGIGEQFMYLVRGGQWRRTSFKILVGSGENPLKPHATTFINATISY